MAELVKFQAGRGKNSTIYIVLFSLLLALFVFVIPQPTNAQTNSITGVIFEDLNFNHELEVGESRIAGWTINLYHNNGLIASHLSIDGRYNFDNLKSGQYVVTLELPEGWFEVSPQSVLVNLEEGQRLETNFGNFQVDRKEKGVSPMMLINNVKAEAVSTTSVKITWLTNYLATSQVVFGKDQKSASQLILPNNNLGYLSGTKIDWQNETYHSVVLTNLKPGTTYYYRVVSLPNPKQWRGSPKVFSNEVSFSTTPSSSVEEPEQPMIKPESKPTPSEQKKQAVPADQSGDSSVVESTSTKESTPADQKESATQPITEVAKVIKTCSFYIWVLLILNLIPIYFIRKFTKKAKNAPKQAWWVGLIIIGVPAILGYPQCWLIIWLLFTFILAIIYLSGFRKKPKPPESLPTDSEFGPFSNPSDEPLV